MKKEKALIEEKQLFLYFEKARKYTETTDVIINWVFRSLKSCFTQ